MTINQLDYFLTLAQTLNYTKASRLLHLTQPHLSKTIVALEQELGVQLFSRNKRDVQLTKAGKVFRSEVGALIPSFNRAVTKTKDAYDGLYGTLDIGFLGTAVKRLLPPIVNRFRLECPNISLNLFDYTYSPLQDALLEDKLDVAILPDRELNDITGVEKKYLISDDMCVVLNSGHALSDRDSADLIDFRDEPFIVLDPKISVRDNNMMTSICLDQGFLPKSSIHANTLFNLLMMVDCNMGVAILARHMAHFATENVRFIPIAGYANYFKLAYAWRARKNPCTDQFVSVIETCREALRIV